MAAERIEKVKQACRQESVGALLKLTDSCRWTALMVLEDARPAAHAQQEKRLADAMSATLVLTEPQERALAIAPLGEGAHARSLFTNTSIPTGRAYIPSGRGSYPSSRPLSVLFSPSAPWDEHLAAMSPAWARRRPRHPCAARVFLPGIDQDQMARRHPHDAFGLGVCHRSIPSSSAVGTNHRHLCLSTTGV